MQRDVVLALITIDDRFRQQWEIGSGIGLSGKDDGVVCYLRMFGDKVLQRPIELLDTGADVLRQGIGVLVKGKGDAQRMFEDQVIGVPASGMRIGLQLEFPVLVFLEAIGAVLDKESPEAA